MESLAVSHSVFVGYRSVFSGLTERTPLCYA